MKTLQNQNLLIIHRLYESYFSLLRIFLSIQFDLVNATCMTKKGEKNKDLDDEKLYSMQTHP